MQSPFESCINCTLEYLGRKERHPLLHRSCCYRSEVGSSGALAEVFAVTRGSRAEGKAIAEAMHLSVITGH